MTSRIIHVDLKSKTKLFLLFIQSGRAQGQLGVHTWLLGRTARNSHNTDCFNIVVLTNLRSIDGYSLRRCYLEDEWRRRNGLTVELDVDAVRRRRLWSPVYQTFSSSYNLWFIVENDAFSLVRNKRKITKQYTKLT